MSVPLALGCLWVIAATIVAFLPMRRQYAPGFALLAAAPVLIVWIGVVHGVWIGAVAVFGFVSMFRNPLIYFWKRATGRRPAHPEEDRP